jgi:phosphatidylinositol alpha-1,6-mannosyltransferase
MQLLFISNEFPPGHGDIRDFNHRLAKTISSGSDITILTVKSQGWKEFDKKAGLKIYRSGEENRRLSSVLLLHKKAAKIISETGFSHIIASGWETAGVTAMNISKKTKIPFSLIIFEEHLKKYLTKGIMIRRLKAVLDKADFIFCLSERTSALLMRLKIKPDKIRIIYAGSNPPERADISNDDIRRFRGSLSLGAKDKLIISSGRLERKNAFDILIWSVYLLRQRVKNFKLLIIGSGPEEKRLKQIMTDMHVESYGAILPMPQKMDAYLKACDIYVQLGRAQKEAHSAEIGTRILEAGYYGKPVIAAASCELSGTLISETGFIVPPLQPVETATAIEKLLSSPPTLKNMSKAAEKRARNNFMWENVSETILRALNQENPRG